MPARCVRKTAITCEPGAKRLRLIVGDLPSVEAGDPPAVAMEGVLRVDGGLDCSSQRRYSVSPVAADPMPESAFVREASRVFFGSHYSSHAQVGLRNAAPRRPCEARVLDFVLIAAINTMILLSEVLPSQRRFSAEDSSKNASNNA
jgi:hypothetical protein